MKECFWSICLKILFFETLDFLLNRVERQCCLIRIFCVSDPDPVYAENLNFFLN